jgi:ribose-phosphate pyrophosphokinase
MILFNDIPLDFKKFPNGETNLTKDFLGGREQLIGHLYPVKITLKYESDADLFQLLLVRKALWFPVDLHIPYFPYSRMDRKSDTHVFTLKSVAKFINWLEFDNVYIYEPHSDVTPALLNKCKIVSVTPELLVKAGFNPEEDFIYYPDAGAQKRYADVIKAKNEIFGIKTRDFATGKLSNPIITAMDEPTGKIFIIDDLCSKGGTFVMAADDLLLGNSNITEINLVVAHCEETIFQGKIFTTDAIHHVYTTDSIPSQQVSGKMSRIPLSSLV